jgi:hypothetical protein
MGALKTGVIRIDETPDFIRKVINQSRKTGGTRFGSPGHVNQQSAELLSPTKKKTLFMKDMKRHGILREFNDINKFFENSPPPEE